MLATLETNSLHTVCFMTADHNPPPCLSLSQPSQMAWVQDVLPGGNMYNGKLAKIGNGADKFVWRLGGTPNRPSNRE